MVGKYIKSFFLVIFKTVKIFFQFRFTLIPGVVCEQEVFYLHKTENDY